MNEVTLGAGCFWGVQYFFDHIEGVVSTTVGYAGGASSHPTYEEVCSGMTGHAEVCKVDFDPGQISLNSILKYFFMMHDPTLINRQGPDIGSQYRSIILCTSEADRLLASEVMQSMQQHSQAKIVTEVGLLSQFWPAEEYHQKFTERTGRGMCHISPDVIKLPL
jgi:methionine-S-sulfoxide reductase